MSDEEQLVDSGTDDFDTADIKKDVPVDDAVDEVDDIGIGDTPDDLYDIQDKEDEDDPYSEIYSLMNPNPGEDFTFN